nr:MAG TPA: desulfoferrodoxin-like protein [Caudoviricetes sp.]
MSGLCDFFNLGEFYICPVCQTFIIPLYAG